MTNGTKTTFEGISLSMRYVLPIMFALFMYNYTQDQQRMNSNFAEMKNGEDKIWTAITVNNKNSESQFSYVYQQCCVGAKSAPPVQQ